MKIIEKNMPSKQTLIFIGLLIVVFVAFSIIVPDGNFFKLSNVSNILADMVIPAIFALGMGIVFAGGGFDLSLGHIGSLSALVIAYLMSPTFYFVPSSAVIMGVLLACVIGALSGVIVSRLGISSFIVTLGMQFFVIGLRQLITGGKSVYISHEGFKSLSSDTLGISNMLIVLVIVGIFCFLFMERAVIGRKIQFMGSNIEASVFKGINVKVLTMLTFIIAAGLSAIGGMLFSARAGAVQLNSVDALLLDAITIAVLSKVLFHNKFKTIGIIAVAFLISMLGTGISMTGVRTEWVEFVKGFIIVVSLYISKIK